MGHCRTCTCPGLRPGAEDPGRQRGRRTTTAQLDATAARRDGSAAVGMVMHGHGPDGLTVRDIVTAMYGSTTPLRVESVRRRLEAMVRAGTVRVLSRGSRGGPGGSDPTRYGLTIYPGP